MGEKRRGGGQGHSSEELVVDIAKGCTDKATSLGLGVSRTVIGILGPGMAVE